MSENSHFAHAYVQIYCRRLSHWPWPHSCMRRSTRSTPTSWALGLYLSPLASYCPVNYSVGLIMQFINSFCWINSISDWCMNYKPCFGLVSFRVILGIFISLPVTIVYYILLGLWICDGLIRLRNGPDRMCKIWSGRAHELYWWLLATQLRWKRNGAREICSWRCYQKSIRSITVC